MAALAPRLLPRTRSLRRSRHGRIWWWAVGITVAINLAAMLALTAVSHLPAAQPSEAPFLIQPIVRQDQPPPATPSWRPAAHQASVHPAVSPMPMPALDLPAVGTAEACLLPTPIAVGPPTDVPLGLPAVVAADASAGLVGDGGIGAPGALTCDTPARREGAFDLDRFYPRLARNRGITGSSRIRLHIGADGQVTAAEVLESEPQGIFDQAAERLGASLRFLPAQLGGQPVASVQDTTITWTVR